MTMASKPQLVLLGYVDEQISSRNQQMASFSVSKIGGTPEDGVDIARFLQVAR